jgi:N-hydroxyarylamine O-acetyltransferase
MARVINNQDIDTPRTHRITLLEHDGDKYIVDVGFGAMCPKTPIKIDTLNDSNEEYRIIKNSNIEFQLELLTPKGYFTLYKFDLGNYTQADCIMGNFYSSNHPNAVFVNNFVVTLKLEDITLSLRNNSYHKISKNHTEIIDITTSKQLYSIINDDFNIPITEEQSTKLFGITKKLLENL